MRHFQYCVVTIHFKNVETPFVGYFLEFKMKEGELSWKQNDDCKERGPELVWLDIGDVRLITIKVI